MVRTESKDVEVGSFKLPEFSLPEPLTGQAVSSIAPGGAAATLVIWCVPSALTFFLFFPARASPRPTRAHAPSPPTPRAPGTPRTAPL